MNSGSLRGRAVVLLRQSPRREDAKIEPLLTRRPSHNGLSSHRAVILILVVRCQTAQFGYERPVLDKNFLAAIEGSRLNGDEFTEVQLRRGSRCYVDQLDLTGELCRASESLACLAKCC